MGWINSTDFEESFKKNKRIRIKDKITKIIKINEKNKQRLTKNTYETKNNKIRNEEKNAFWGQMTYI